MRAKAEELKKRRRNRGTEDLSSGNQMIKRGSG